LADSHIPISADFSQKSSSYCFFIYHLCLIFTAVSFS